MLYKETKSNDKSSLQLAYDQNFQLTDYSIMNEYLFYYLLNLPLDIDQLGTLALSGLGAADSTYYTTKGYEQ